MGLHHLRRAYRRLSRNQPQTLTPDAELREKPFERRRVDEVAVNDEQRAAGLQDAEPLAKGCGRVDQRPHEVPGDDGVVAAVGLHGILGVANIEADGAPAGPCFLTGAFEHGLGPIQALHLEAEIVEQMGNHASATGKIEGGAAIARTEMLQKQAVPGGALVF